MRDISIATLCSGAEGVGVGAKAAGLKLAWGIEINPALAEMGNTNLGNHIKVANLLDCNPFKFHWVNGLHLSLPCINASQANNTAETNEDGLRESPLDIALANKAIEFITVLRPDFVTIENVWGWRKFQSWRGGKKCKGIQQALYDAGYWVSVEHVNAADYGVPQTRKRMIVRAVRGGFVPALPPPVPWVGWYAAIEDLLPTLPESQFAPWQLARLPAELKTMLVAQGGYGGKLVSVNSDDPSFTITANSNQGGVRALLMGGSNTSSRDAYPGVGVSEVDEPTLCVATNSYQWRAFLVGKTADKYGDGVRQWCEPAHTIGANEHGSRAFIVDSQNASPATGEPTCRLADEPVFTVAAGTGSKGTPRAFESGRVVAMTQRCLARFQSFPDWYVLPESKTLAAKGIGNAVPPLLMQRVYESLLEVAHVGV